MQNLSCKAYRKHYIIFFERYWTLLLGIVSLAFLLGVSRPVHSATTTQEQALFLSINTQKKIWPNLQLFFTPEIRTEAGKIDRYLFEAGMKYKPLKYISLRTAYRPGKNKTKNGMATIYRWRFDIIGMMPLSNIEPQIRLRYAELANPPKKNKHRLTYQVTLVHQYIKTLAAAATIEAFYDLSEERFVKRRYSMQVEYKFYNTKKLDQYIELTYKLDDHLNEYLHVHILDLSYKVKF